MNQLPLRNFLFGLIVLFTTDLAHAGGMEGGGVALNIHFLVCDFMADLSGPQPHLPLKIIVTGEITKPISQIEGYRPGVAGWSKLSEFESLRVTRNFYRIAPRDPSNQTFAYRYQSYPVESDRRVDILLYSGDVDSFGLYKATMSLRNVMSRSQDERFSGTCRIDVPYNKQGPLGI